MEKIEKKYLDNSFILLGRTGYGKSTACKALTGNENIKISQGHNSCTSEVSYYPGTFIKNNNNLYFTMIDTPGLDDSDGRDQIIYQDLRNMFQTKNLKVKGIIIVFSLQNNRFGQSEKTIIQKIINLVPIKNLWKYFTILVTHCYSNKPEKLEKKKKEFKNDIKDLFEKDYIPNSFLKYGIIGKFEDINIVFTDFDDEDPSIEEAKEITEIIEKSLNKEPIFKKCIEEIQDNVSVLEFNDSTKKSAVVYKCRIKKIKYIGQNGKILNEIRIILDKKKDKEITKSKLNWKASLISEIVSCGIGFISIAGLAFPPLEMAAIIGIIGGFSSGIISTVFGVHIGLKDEAFNDNPYINEFIDETK